MYYMSIGYPLGIKGTDFIVETQNTDVKLTPPEVLEWVNCQGVNIFDEISYEMKQLEYYGVLCSGETYDILYKKASTFRTVRQGCGSYDDGNCAIYLDEKIFYPAQIQYNIWKLSNSKRTLAQIWMLIKQVNADLTVDEYIKNIGTLITENLLFVE